MESGVEFVAVDIPHANKLTIHILAAVAQHEREMISEPGAAKKRGQRLGIGSRRQGDRMGMTALSTMEMET